MTRLAHAGPLLWPPAAVAAAAAGSLWLGALIPFTQNPGWLALTNHFRPDHGWPDDLVLVAIDDATVGEHGEWPWPAELQTRLVEKLDQAGVKTIVLDLPPSDVVVASSLAPELAARIVAPMQPAASLEWFPQGTMSHWRWPLGAGRFPQERHEKSWLGHTWFQHGAAELGVQYQIPCPQVTVDDADTCVRSAALVGYALQRGESITVDATEIRIGDRVIGTPRSRLHLDIPSNLDERRPFIPAADVLASSSETLRGKLAIVYLSRTYDASNWHPVPLAPGFYEQGLVTATVYRTLANGRTTEPMRPLPFVLACAIPLAAFGGRIRRARPSRIVAASILGIGLVVVATAVLLGTLDLRLPAGTLFCFNVLGGFVLTLAASRTAEKDRNALQHLLRLSQQAESRVTVEVAGKPEPGVALTKPIRLGRYEVRRQIGTGGSSNVFLAWDLELEREVAMKVLDASGSDGFPRFRREARAMARVDHPNVVAIHDIGADTMAPFLVMEYCRGGTLAERLRAGRRHSVPEALTLVAGAARGLGAAHAHGIVHCDVKPANLLFADATVSGVKVADFGVAKLNEDGDAPKGSFTGTIGYLSPEQARGLRLDARSDVYSLGVLLYRLCTGVAPFKGSPSQLLRQTLEGRVPDPRETAPDVPEPAAAMVTRMTSPDPAQRPTDGAAVAVELQSILERSA